MNPKLLWVTGKAIARKPPERLVPKRYKPKAKKFITKTLKVTNIFYNKDLVTGPTKGYM